MEILSSIVGTVAEHTVVPIGRQASYLIFYKDNFSMLEVYVKDLEAAKERITHSIEEERRKGKKIEIVVMNWLKKVDEVIEKANQLQNDPRRANARCSAWPFPNLILRHRLSRKATKIVKDFIEVQEKGKSDQIGYHPTRKLLKEIIMKALTHPNSCNIGVYGLAGVGKTTLVNEVSQISKQQKLFDTVTTTNVTKYPDIKRIQGEIADLLGLQFDEETILGRAERLRQRIMMEKNILVILDDIWTKLDLKKVGIPFGNEHNGCKLLMTSRNLDVLLQMDVPKDFTFKLELMSENESWELFQIMAGDVVKDINLQSLASQVAKQCRGLPLVVATVARAMKHQRDVQSWKDALRRLQHDDHLTIFSALELSYNWLESDEMRDVFLLFALFPCEKVHYFVKVAMGLDILKDIKTVDDARNRLYSIIHSLKANSLIEIKTSGNIQMHDFVRDFAISIARRHKHVYLRNQSDEEWPTKDFLTRCTQVVLDSCVSELPQMIDCPNNKFFYLSSKKNRSLEVPDDFFEGMGSLRVLDLTFLNLSSLPTSFRFLTDLQTLCLNFCILENMVEIEALQNLVILCLRGSPLTNLPREIRQLTQLRMLDLSNSGIEVIPPNIISSLTKLEELYMGNTFVNWEDVSSTVQNKNASIAELQKLPNLTTLELQIRETWMLPRDLRTVFEKLERYKIAIGDVWEWSDIVDGTSKTLMLKLGTNIHLEHGIKALIKGVENLYLDDVDGIQNVVYQLNVEGFPLLKHLHVQNNANMKHIVDSQERNQIHVFFPLLETLVLHNLKNLEHIWNKIGNYNHHSMCNLTSLIVASCGGLKYLFSSTMVGSFKNIKHVEISNCPLMEEIIVREERNNEIEEELNSHFLSNKCVGSLFPKLEVLHIEGCPLLEYIFPFLFFHELPVLETIKIRKCAGLKYIFGQYQHVEFSSLRQLELSQLPDFIDMFFKSNHLISLSEKGSSSTSNHGSNKASLQLDLDPVKCKDTATTTIPLVDGHYSESNSYCLNIWERAQCLQIPSKILYNIKKMELSHFSIIKSVFIPSIASRMLLETLTIRNCYELKNIIDFGDYDSGSNTLCNVFPKLKELYIEGCPKMEYIFGHYTDDHHNHVKIQLIGSLFPKLEVLDIEGCPLLEYIFPFLFFHELPVLETIKIRKCAGLKYIFGQYQHVEFSSLRQLELSQLPYFIDIFSKSNHLISFSEKGSSSTSNYGSNAQLQLDLDPMKCNIFSWDTTTTTIPFVDGHYSESNSYCLNIWERAQCLQIPSTILYNIKKIELSHLSCLSKIKSVFIPSIAPRMLVETLIIRNCDELKNITEFGDCDSGSNNWGNVFPKMKELYIEDCPKMDYIFGHDTNDHQNQVEIQLQLLELKCLSLCKLPRLVAMCPKHYRIRFPPLSKLELNKCSSAATKSMSQFIIDPVSESLDSTIIKDYGDIDDIEDVFFEDIEDVNVDGSHETTEVNNEGSLNHGSFMKATSNIKEQIPKDDDVRVSKTSKQHQNTSYLLHMKNGIASNNCEIVETEMNATTEGKQEFVVNIPGLVIKMKQRENSEIFVETKMKHTAEANQEFVVNVSGLEILEVTNSQQLLNEQSTSQLGEIDTAVKPSQLEGSTSEKSAAAAADTQRTKNEADTQLYAPRQKGIKITVEDGNTSANDKTISTHSELVSSSSSESETSSLDIEKTVEERTTSTYEKTIMSSTHLEDGDGKISLPSFSTSTMPAATKYVDIGDYQETIAMEDIDNLIEDNPLLAFEKFLTGQVSISSIRVLLQELKTLMDSSSDLDHLVSNQESKSKLISLFHQLNQHQGMLTSDLKDFVEKVQNFFNENIIKHTTSQQVLNHHDKLLDSKSDLMNKLWSAKKTQAHIDSETSTANAQIQIDDLKSVMKICDVQKMKLKSECTEWAQQSKELISALASSKVAVREVERARNLAKEDFANLKSSFPTF